jgi:hypothetical protein
MWTYLACALLGVIIAAGALWMRPQVSHTQRSINRTLREKSIPRELRRELSEARSCYNAKAHTAAVVMVRRTLEGVCALHGVNQRNLHSALQEMATKDLLDGRLLKWADSLRVLGNEGAHYTGSSVRREDASDALALAEAVLHYLYALTAKFEEFEQRRQKAVS